MAQNRLLTSAIKHFLSHRGYGVRQDKCYTLYTKLGQAYVIDYTGCLKMWQNHCRDRNEFRIRSISWQSHQSGLILWTLTK